MNHLLSFLGLLWDGLRRSYAARVMDVAERVAGDRSHAIVTLQLRGLRERIGAVELVRTGRGEHVADGLRVEVDRVPAWFRRRRTLPPTAYLS